MTDCQRHHHQRRGNRRARQGRRPERAAGHDAAAGVIEGQSCGADLTARAAVQIRIYLLLNKELLTPVLIGIKRYLMP
jgi:hypothetical protein